MEELADAGARHQLLELEVDLVEHPESEPRRVYQVSEQHLDQQVDGETCLLPLVRLLAHLLGQLLRARREGGRVGGSDSDRAKLGVVQGQTEGEEKGRRGQVSATEAAARQLEVGCESRNS